MKLRSLNMLPRPKSLGAVACAVALALTPAPLFAETAKQKPISRFDAVKQALELATIPLVPVACLGVPLVIVTISANEDNVNLFTKAGSPGFPVELRCTINAGVLVGSTSTASHAFDVTNSWAAGTRLRLTNLGTIMGKGGAGGDGGDVTETGCSPHTGTAANGANGGNGGPALNAPYPIEIDNGSGTIAGGGGGGAGGGGAFVDPVGGCIAQWIAAGGGAGGGGQGSNTAAGGIGGDATTINCIVGQTFLSDGGNGTSGNSSAAGSGVAGGSVTCNGSTIFGQAVGGTGGNGGTLGNAGSAGTAGSTSDCALCGSITVATGSAGTAGAAGNCTTGNSNITWLATGTRLGPLN